MSRSESAAPARRPRLHVVVLAHLDTQWRWTVRETVADFLPATVRENEDRFRRFPGYVLSFEGAHRYRLLAECHPELLDAVRRRTEEGRWFPAGAAWEAFDANLPAPESIVRQILLGRRELERTVGRASDDLFLPDCFGFPRSLPTIAAHCGIVGFSTQKLRRGAEMRAAHGIPFPIGRWRGADGSEIVAVLDPGEYGAQTREDLSRSAEWLARFAALDRQGRPMLLQTYQGLGDKGGAIARETAGWLETAAASGGPLDVRVGPSEAIYRDLDAGERARLPEYEGDLLLRLHATGCYTSRGQLKRWHRQAEALAQAGERAAALAAPLRTGAERAAVRDSLRSAWELVLSHQMHDDLTGTSLPEAYRHSADGLSAALNGFAEQLEEAVERIASGLDTATAGEPIAVFNPLSMARRELVELRFLAAGPGEAPPRILDAGGADCRAQWCRVEGGFRGLFVAQLEALSIAIFELRRGEGSLAREPATDAALELELESGRYRLRIDEHGDLASWLEVASGRELLAAPAGIELLADRSERFPSWELRFEDLARAPRCRLRRPIVSRWLDRGPLRQRLRIEQSVGGSRWKRDYVLDRIDGDERACSIRVDHRVDWCTDATLAKADFRFAWEFPEALYDLGIGVASRPVSTRDQYEVPAQGFAAAPRAAGGGAIVLSDVKQGWDHPEADRLRLTLLHTPRIGRRFRYQRRQDFGAHRFSVGLASWSAEESLARVAETGERFRQPPLAFRVRAGSTGSARVWAPIRFADRGALLSALKPAEDGDGLVLRLRDSSGEADRDVPIALAPELRLGAEVDGAERPVLAARAAGESGFRLRRFGFSSRRIEWAEGAPNAAIRPDVALDFARDVFAVSSPRERSRGGGCDGRGRALPRQLLPRRLSARGIEHDLTELHRAGEASALRLAGQRLEIPAGFRRLALLVGVFGAPVAIEVELASGRHLERVPDSLAPAGRFDELRDLGRLLGREPVRRGFLERQPSRLRVPHLHDRHGAIEACAAATLFGLELAVEPAGDFVRLPSCPRALLFAATLGVAPPPAVAALVPLFEDDRADA